MFTYNSEDLTGFGGNITPMHNMGGTHAILPTFFALAL